MLRGGLFLGLVLLLAAKGWGAESSSSTAEVNSPEAQAARAKKTGERLDIARTQLERRLYEAALKTLEQCRRENGSLPAAQRQRLEQYTRQAQAGLQAQERAETLIRQASQALTQGNLHEAAQALQQVRPLHRYLSKPTKKKIDELNEALKTQRARRKQEMKALFKRSVMLYKQGDLEAARRGFLRIKESGLKLSFWDRGDLTDTEGYLKKIAARLARQQQTKPPAGQAPPTVVEPESPTMSEQVEAAVVTEPGTSAGTAERTLQAAAAPAETGPASLPEKTETVAAVAPAAPSSKTPPTPPTKKKAGGLLDWLSFGKGKKGPKLTDEQIRRRDELLANGDLAMSQGKYALAKEYYQQVLAIDPHLEAARRGL